MLADVQTEAVTVVGMGIATPPLPPARPRSERYSPEMEADPVIHRCTAPDGVELAYRQFGEGRPLVLVHGFSSDSQQWIDHGLAAAFAAPGHRVIMPDLRGHGASGRPHEASAYPPDVLADDGLAVVSALGLPNNGYDLFGYSMGGRVVLRMLVRGADGQGGDRRPGLRRDPSSQRPDRWPPTATHRDGRGHPARAAGAGDG